jgi:hypothetical protein
MTTLGHGTMDGYQPEAFQSVSACPFGRVAIKTH